MPVHTSPGHSRANSVKFTRRESVSRRGRKVSKLAGSFKSRLNKNRHVSLMGDASTTTMELTPLTMTTSHSVPIEFNGPPSPTSQSASRSSQSSQSMETDDDDVVVGGIPQTPEHLHQAAKHRKKPPLRVNTDTTPTKRLTLSSLKTPLIKVSQSSLASGESRGELRSSPTKERSGTTGTTSTTGTTASAERSGIISSFMSSIGLKKGLFSEEQGTESETDSVVEPPPALPETQQDLSSPSADSVTFTPVKKSLLSTLGQGGLTLSSVMADNAREDESEEEHISPHHHHHRQSSPTRSIVRSPVRSLSASPAIKSAGAAVPTQLDSLLLDGRLPSRSVSMLGRSHSRSRSHSQSHSRGRSQSLQVGPGMQQQQQQQMADEALSVGDLRRRSTTGIPERVVSGGMPETPVDGESTGFSSENDSRRNTLARRMSVKVPSQKRQEAFHQLFPDVPADEMFIGDFTCAYRREILIQGRLYLSERHVGFHSNIIGLVTHFNFELDKVLSIEKKKTVGIPNTLGINTLHDKFIFATFLQRDSTYDLLYRAWTKSNPKFANTDSESVELGVDDEMDVSDEDGAEGYAESEIDESILEDQLTEAEIDNDSTISDEENMVKAEDEAKESDKSFPGPRHHKPTASLYQAEQSETLITQGTVPAPLGQVFELLFADDGVFPAAIMKAQGNIDMTPVPRFVNNTRKFSYTKPLDAPVGPKQTRCNVTEQIEKKDFEGCCVVIQTSETPDVPSGGSFKIRTRFFLHWGEGDSTTLAVYTSAIWTGKSWIKGAVERGNINGQKKSMEVTMRELCRKAAMGDKPGKKKKGGSRKPTGSRVGSKAVAVEPVFSPVPEQSSQPQTQSSGGLFGSINQTLEMIGFDLKTVVIVVLVVILLWGRLFSHHAPPPAPTANQVVFAPLEPFNQNSLMQSEADLWDWIDRRHESGKTAKRPFLTSDSDTDNIDRATAKLNSQELDEMVRLMERRLQVLRDKRNVAV